MTRIDSRLLPSQGGFTHRQLLGNTGALHLYADTTTTTLRTGHPVI